MYPYELDIAILSLQPDGRPEQTFTLPAPIIRLLSRFVSYSAVTLPGQPNLSSPGKFNNLADTVAFFQQLGSDTNGYKLKLPANKLRFTLQMLYRTARGLDGQVLVGTYTPANP